MSGLLIIPGIMESTPLRAQGDQQQTPTGHLTL
jgi:hypothetical protein